MRTQPQDALTVEQDLWDEAAHLFSEVTAQKRVIVPDEHCTCLGCEVARLHLLPFLPVTWH